MITPAIGELEESINIVNVTNPYNLELVGTISSTFASNVRAKIEPLGGELGETTQQIQYYRQLYRVWIWCRDGVTAFQQIVWGTKRLIMTGPPEEIGQFLLINAEERIERAL